MSALTHEDLNAARAQWEEWTAGTGFDLDVQIVGEHLPVAMDPDRPLGAIIEAHLSLRLRITLADMVVFDERCPYDGRALRLDVARLARAIAER